MHKLLCGIGLSVLVCINVEAQQLMHCEPSQSRVLRSANELPDQVQALIGRSIKGTSGIADINEEFNPTDVIIDPLVPRRRIASGLISDSCIRLTIEHGGRGRYVEHLEFQLTAQGWHKIESPEVVVSSAGIRTAQGTVQTPTQLIELLQKHGISKVKLRPLQDAGYEAIGKVIYGLTRAGIEIEIEPPVPG